MNPQQNSDLKIGYRYALLAYVTWGFFPIYWKLLKTVPAIEILLHRVVWSWLFYSLIQIVRTKSVPRIPKINLSDLRWIGLASLLIGCNWLLYIYGVNSGQILETSLGYFINPLVNVLIGIFILRERLLPHHKVALVFCTLGVIILTIQAGHPPWIAFGLALTFGFYGFIKKQIPMTSLRAGQWESALLIPPLVTGLLLTKYEFHPYSNIETALLVGTGVVTGLPLMWFMDAAKRLPYYLMGIFQYVAPSLQFLTGALLYHEAIPRLKAVGFLFIWLGIAWILRHSFLKIKTVSR